MADLTEYRLRVPLRLPLRGVEARDVLLVEGPEGWGECSPWPGDPTDPGACRRSAEEAATSPWPAATRDRIEVTALVPGVPPDRAEALAADAVEAGFRSLKVKVGAGDDVGRVAAVRAAAGASTKVRVDANGAWDVDAAVDALSRLTRFDLELVEQPVATLHELAEVRRRVDVPVAADEGVRSLDDARRIPALGAADAVVLKVQATGGVRAALEWADAAGVPAIVGSFVETSVGLAAGAALAAALPELPYACGLGTADLLAEDVVSERLAPVGGELAVRRVVPEPDRLRALAAGALR